MDNKFTEIDTISKQARFFKMYLQESLDKETFEILDCISRKTDVYVFSGIIRNFFLGESSYRDLDIVVGDVDCVLDIFNNTNKTLNFSINSFGGIKLKIQNLSIDLWSLESTWGIKKESMPLSPESLLKTSFFNFSAIVFDYNKTRFYYENAFPAFLKTKMMDVVYTKNPNIPLCIINSCYYREIYGFGLNLTLCRWIFNSYVSLLGKEKSPEIFDMEQVRHFSKIIIQYDKIKDFILLCYRHSMLDIPIFPNLFTRSFK